MKARAIQRNIHISSRKAGLVCELIRGKKVSDAITILTNTHKKGARIILKILNSAMANAINNHSMNAEKLYVYEAFANQGRTLKRMLPRAKGSSNMIRKRHSHIEIIVSDDRAERKNDLMLIKQKVANKKQSKKTTTTVKANISKPEIKKASTAKKPQVKKETK